MATKKGLKQFWLNRAQEEMVFTLLGSTESVLIKQYLLRTMKQELDAVVAVKAKQLENKALEEQHEKCLP